MSTIPTPALSTYRLQMTAGFGFAAAAEVLPYLAELGISHVYASPYLQAGKGSTHGYDVVNHKTMSQELGGPEAHAAFCSALKQAGLGQVLDIVPNHMAITGEQNNLWWDVLENGRGSRYAAYFDIDWDRPDGKLRGKVLMPVLGDHYGKVVDAGDLKVGRQAAAFTIHYYDHATPLAPESLCELLTEAAERCRSNELAFIAAALERLPTKGDTASVVIRRRDKEVLLAQLERLFESEPATALSVDAVIAGLNADPERMDALLEAQHYRLAYWRTAGRELNYRRFFNINTLAGIRVEDPKVFHDTHALLLSWAEKGYLDGLRIDHPDGLRDPEEYLRRLREAAPRSWIVIEKILEPGEELPSQWPVDGTTGYDFLNVLGGLFIDQSAVEPLTRLYQEFTGCRADYQAVVRECKQLILADSFGGELGALTNALVELSQHRRAHRDFSRHELFVGVRELLTCFPVYRTYIRPPVGPPREQDAKLIQQAVQQAAAHRLDIDPLIWAFLEGLLLGRLPGEAESDLVMRFQQLTGPVMAKGVEDTAFYRYNRLICLNEVGGDPGRFGTSSAAFHDFCGRVARTWPRTMVTTSTHDTKRGEDARLRIAALCEMPEAWAARVREWSATNAAHKSDGRPDANDEYLLYQTLVGAWPLAPERLAEFLTKAAREAKVHTSWSYPNAEYEAALLGFAAAVTADGSFQVSLKRFIEGLLPAARLAGLSHTLLKYTAVGVPDCYQGAELWNESLVDPDNRRPVEFGVRRQMLAECRSLRFDQTFARLGQGFPKLWLTWAALRVRQRFPTAFIGGEYSPLTTGGPRADRLLAFARGAEVAVIAPRLLQQGGDWEDTEVALPGGAWHDVLTGRQHEGRVRADELPPFFPGALLTRAPLEQA